MTATRTALVTGASRGIGQATAQRLASLGFDVIAQHRGDDSELNPIREVAAEHQTTVTPVQADFSEPGAVEAPGDGGAGDARAGDQDAGAVVRGGRHGVSFDPGKRSVSPDRTIASQRYDSTAKLNVLLSRRSGSGLLITVII